MDNTIALKMEIRKVNTLKLNVDKALLGRMTALVVLKMFKVIAF